MITPMKKITVCGVQKDRKAVLELIQKSGCVEFIQNTPEEDINASHPDVADRITQFDRYISLSKRAIEILDEVSPEKSGMFKVRKDISIDNYSMQSGEISTIGSVAMDIISCEKSISDNLLSIGKLSAKIASIEPWLSLDVPMNTSGTDYTRTYLMSYPGEITIDALDDMLHSFSKDVYYEIEYSSKNISNVFFLVLRKSDAEVTKLLREIGFSIAQVGLSHRTPEKKIENIKEKIFNLEAKNKELTDKIKSYAQKRDDIKLLYDHLSIRKEKYENLQKLLVTDEAFVIEGYIPQPCIEKLKAKLDNTGCCSVQITDIAPDEEAPVLFKNNSFVKPVENITSDYSMPSKRDIDPNAIMSIFYYAFFGMMFSDAGYGLLMMLVCGFIGFIAKAESSTKNFMRMFFYCGVSTFIWGVLFGSFFGDAIKSLKPLWINPVDEPLLLLIFSIGLGLMQILAGLVCKFYVDYRAGEKTAAIFDSGSWIFVLAGAAIAGGGVFLKLSPIATAGIALAVVGLISIVLMKGRDNKNIISRLFSGILGLYDVTSYVSDLLSYSRLMALGLATGVIGQVVNVMASLAGGGIVGIILSSVIFIIGHALNFAINVLGAYVHTNRLQYVEFYSKFYEGGGRKFNPLSLNTKYYKFMEDDEKC